MKRTVLLILSILMFYLLTNQTFAQTPQAINYQGVARDTSGSVLSNKTVSIRLSILSGSFTGTTEYIETHSIITDNFGLFNLSIGQGAVVSGTFNAINWGSSTYFFKVEIDPAGGNNYQLVGTNQFLSVPYALHAKTADNGFSANTHYIGELYGGGVVFWVDLTGNHGLICSMTDLSTGIIWTTTAYQSITVPGGALSDWDGQGNTNAIVAQTGAGTSYAAGLCDAYTNANYGTGIYSDWYLPSRGELNHLWNNIYQVQKTLDTDGNPATTAMVKTYYWSSSEYLNTTAWFFTFGSGSMNASGKGMATFYVRAVRAF